MTISKEMSEMMMSMSSSCVLISVVVAFVLWMVWRKKKGSGVKPHGPPDRRPDRRQDRRRDEGPPVEPPGIVVGNTYIPPGVVPPGPGVLEQTVPENPLNAPALVQVTGTPDRMSSNQWLGPGQKLISQDQTKTLEITEDGAVRIMASGTMKNPPLNALHKAKNLILQTDGNIVVYTTKDEPIWASNTYNQGDNLTLVVKNSGDLELLKADGTIVWNFDTHRPPNTRLLAQTTFSDEAKIDVAEGNYFRIATIKSKTASLRAKIDNIIAFSNVLGANIKDQYFQDNMKRCRPVWYFMTAEEGKSLHAFERIKPHVNLDLNDVGGIWYWDFDNSGLYTHYGFLKDYGTAGCLQHLVMHEMCHTVHWFLSSEKKTEYEQIHAKNYAAFRYKPQGTSNPSDLHGFEPTNHETFSELTAAWVGLNNHSANGDSWTRSQIEASMKDLATFLRSLVADPGAIKTAGCLIDPSCTKLC